MNITRTKQIKIFVVVDELTILSKNIIMKNEFFIEKWLKTKTYFDLHIDKGRGDEYPDMVPARVGRHRVAGRGHVHCSSV